jgi:hypothetical protein
MGVGIKEEKAACRIYFIAFCESIAGQGVGRRNSFMGIFGNTGGRGLAVRKGEGKCWGPGL